MTPFWSDDHLTLYGGDCREVLRELPAESVHCVVTSPPYWGLRDYGTATWAGGDEACDHRKVQDTVAAVATSTLGGGKKTTGHQQEGHRVACPCGATRIDSQLGLEATPEEYVANMVAVFREVRRVLRKDGTLWLNLGDSYYTGISQTIPKNTQPKTFPGLKPKDLVGIPWRVAFALQADGWYLRSDIIWSKPNPMPESVTDRPTKAHEYLFLLTRSPRYYYDAEAVREASGDWSAKMPDGWDTGEGGHGTIHRNGREKGANNGASGVGRNLRSVWTIATEPYPGAHFATFPRKLVEPCVKAGCPEGGVVLDPFAGSGTTLLVGQHLGRRGIGIDLNPEYLKQALVRNAQTPLGLVG